MKYPVITVWGLLAGVLMASGSAAASEPASESGSAQAFVQDFYTWYLKEEKQEHDMDLSDFAVKTKPQLFSAAIIQGLKEDAAAQAKVPDEVVGLDFDPFLNAQDICEPYTTGKVTQSGTTYKVEVFDHCSDSKPGKPAVIAAVEKQGRAWVFVDFYYPGYGDLFSVLRSLKQEREKPGK